MFLVIKPDPFVILVKPRTYLSKIGPTVKNLVNFYIRNYQGEMIKLPGSNSIIKFGPIEKGEREDLEKLVSKGELEDGIMEKID